ncbi:Phosphatidylserine/phosphatidylglycerophosphate/cardiolipin synthase [Pseudomonas sp. URIL14HWK12:I9]|nr:putative cardiolipin synthase [Pseudomonas sp. URIL14HWK12:I12]PVZ24708.1 putative cardiolipin synthase [Pseudomonas sp. URIL14HWK12:I10]PVZ34553.1 putative cardiolipin synthase [Pseudomonas sp. URIL14HWK12:I11]SNZ08635.1 Phosphatidylserine/phosphatidylglycerophosphate/cardiolipin synthase [Pseudomonas sp. URIL14HWK12:I9]
MRPSWPNPGGVTCARPYCHIANLPGPGSYLLKRFALLLLLFTALAGCSVHYGPRQPSEMLPAQSSGLGRQIMAQSQAHGGQSGFHLLPRSGDAFGARAELIHNAQRSIDLQYYIVHDGLSTRALLNELLAAADRGVRVRILLDDTTSDGLDDLLAALASHPGVEVRLFNPLHLGRANGMTRGLGRLMNLSTQHRRMHNKLMIADDSAAVVGGRNIGDEYFDAEPNLNFTDMDLLGTGPVAQQLGYSFDQYWNSRLSRPIGEVYGAPSSSKALARLRTDLQVSLKQAQVKRKALYDRLMAWQQRPLLDQWREQLIWANAQVLWDAPSKILSRGEPDPHLLLTTQLAPELLKVNQELVLVSAYFVPRETGLLYLTGRADAGVRVSLLTNSLEATDVPAVHGGYAPYRKALLEHGVKLYELRRQPGDEGKFSYRLHGSSDSSLHTKAIILDQRKVFLGSFNFDPRSVLWNTEVGVMVDSPQLAHEARALALQGMSPTLSYQVKLANGQLVWVTEDGGQLHTLTKEPGGWWRSFNAWVSKAVGLERML